MLSRLDSVTALSSFLDLTYTHLGAPLTPVCCIQCRECVCVTWALGAWACCSQEGRAVRNVLIILLFGLWSPKLKCTACIYLGLMQLWWFLVGVGRGVLAVYSSPARKARYKAEQVPWQASGRSLGIRARAWSWTSARILKPWLDSLFLFFFFFFFAF